jgi:hypothetical protein
MKQSLVYGFTVSALLVLGGAKIAFADVAPPVGYVEQCTVEKQQAAGKACVACKNDYTSFVGDAGDRCVQQYEQCAANEWDGWALDAWRTGIGSAIAASLSQVALGSPGVLASSRSSILGQAKVRRANACHDGKFSIVCTLQTHCLAVRHVPCCTGHTPFSHRSL